MFFGVPAEGVSARVLKSFFSQKSHANKKVKNKHIPAAAEAVPPSAVAAEGFLVWLR